MAKRKRSAAPAPGPMLEPLPSIATATRMRAGKLTDHPLWVISLMNDGGVIFADGIERDFIAFDCGRRVHLSPTLANFELTPDRTSETLQCKAKS